MKHTDFYALHKKLDEQARNELMAAIKAHGDEYIFIHEDEDGDYNNEEKNNAPVIAASTRYMDGYEDFYVVRVALEDNWLQIYGFPKDGWDICLHFRSYSQLLALHCPTKISPTASLHA